MSEQKTSGCVSLGYKLKSVSNNYYKEKKKWRLNLQLSGWLIN